MALKRIMMTQFKPVVGEEWHMRASEAVVAVAVLVLAGNEGRALAAIPAPNVSAWQDNAHMTWTTVSVVEASCDDICTTSFNVQLKAGYSASSAVVFMNLYYLRFPDSATDSINHAKLVVERNSYNPTTGLLNVTVTAELVGQTPNRVFEFGIWFTALAGDNTNVIAREKTVAGFAGAGAGGSCDSSATCTDGATLTGVGNAGSGVPFDRALIRGFDVGTLSGNFVRLSGLGFDSSAYTAVGTTAVGSSACRFLSPAAGGYEDLNCELYLSTLAFRVSGGTTTVATTSIVDSTTGATTSAYQGVYGFCPSTPTTVDSFLLGLVSTNQTPSTDIAFGGTNTGTGASSLDAGTPTTVYTQGTHGLYPSIGYGGAYAYDGSIESFLGCVY